GPALAGDEHRGVRGRHGLGQAEHLEERPVLADRAHAPGLVPAAHLALQRPVLLLQHAGLGGAPAERDEVRVAERLLEVVERALVHGLHGGLERCLGGHEDDRDLGVALADRGQDVEPGDAGHADVREDDVRGVAVDLLERLAAGMGHVDVESLAPEQDLEGVEDRALVVYDQDSRFQYTSLPRTAGSVSRAGKYTVKRAPRPGAESTKMAPWCASTARCTRARPRPDPPFRVVKNGSKIRGTSSGAMPGPSSSTTSRTGDSRCTPIGSRSSPTAAS